MTSASAVPSAANVGYPALRSRRKTSIAASPVTTVMTVASTRPGDREDDEQEGTRRAALIARWRTASGPASLAPEPAMARGELDERGVERLRPEVRPQRSVKYSSAYCDCQIRKLLMRCSRPVRMSRSSGGRPAV